ncbi:MAG: vanomycin resistance protein VanB [Clostridiales bacterium]|nr:vanomycin resistance protein VanB [Clostridiales bacterium]
MKETRNIRKNKNIFSSIYFKISIVLVIIFSGVLAYSLSINSKVNKWDNVIYPGVTIEDIDVSGKTKEEALKILEDEFSSKIGDKEILVKVGSEEKKYYYNEFSPSYDVEKAVEDAYLYGKSSNLLKKNKIISGKEKINVSLDFTYDENKFQEFEERLIADFNISPKDASITINNGNIKIVDDVVGYELNSENLKEDLKGVLNGKLDEKSQITLNLEEKKAAITTEELKKIKNKPMSTFQTSFQSSGEDRSYNVALATSLVNGTLLMPGETFSYSAVSQKGRGKYKDAAVYINNKVEQAEAGGICQVSTTLYRAVMKANIRSVERLNHSLPVGYAEKGLDATVAWGSIDYKFKNTYDFPIYIEGITQNKNVIFNIYGDPDALGNKTYNMESEIIETIPGEIVYKEDPTLEVGVEEVESEGQAGYKVKSYQITYENGIEVKREEVATDKYASQPTVIRKGSKLN